MKRKFKSKNVFLSLLFAAGLAIATLGPSRPAQAQAYCGWCCGSSPYGLVRVCPLVSAVPCGNDCWCSNAPGTGVACP